MRDTRMGSVTRGIATLGLAATLIVGCGGGAEEPVEQTPATVTGLDWRIGAHDAGHPTLSIASGTEADLWLELSYSDGSTRDERALGLCVDFFNCSGPAEPIGFQVTLSPPTGTAALLRTTGASGTGRILLQALSVAAPVDVTLTLTAPGVPTLTKVVTIEP